MLLPGSLTNPMSATMTHAADAQRPSSVLVFVFGRTIAARLTPVGDAVVRSRWCYSIGSTA
jgi:hypothetical protein